MPQTLLGYFKILYDTLHEQRRYDTRASIRLIASAITLSVGVIIGRNYASIIRPRSTLLQCMRGRGVVSCLASHLTLLIISGLKATNKSSA